MAIFINFLDDLSRVLSSYYMVIRGDKIAHFIVGAAVCWLMMRLIKSEKIALIVVFALEMFKELVIDITVTLQKRDYIEPATDIIATVAGAVMVVYFRKKNEAVPPVPRKKDRTTKKARIDDFLE